MAETLSNTGLEAHKPTSPLSHEESGTVSSVKLQPQSALSCATITQLVDAVQADDASDKTPSIKKVFFGSDLPAFLERVSKAFKLGKAPFTLFIDMDGEHMQAPLEAMVGGQENHALILKVDEIKAQLPHEVKKGRVQKADPTKSTAGKNTEKQLTHFQNNIMHGEAAEYCYTCPVTGGFYTKTHQDCNVRALEKTVNKCLANDEFDGVQRVVLKAALYRYLQGNWRNHNKKDANGNFCNIDKRMAEKARARIKKEETMAATSAKAKTETTTSTEEETLDEEGGTDDNPAPSKRKKTPSSKAAANILAAAKSGKLSAPSERSKKKKS